MKQHTNIRKAEVKNLLTFLFLTISVASFGQTISGTIIDRTKNEGLPYVVILLLDSTEKITVKSAISDFNGKFIFDKITLNTVSIKTSYLGYDDTIFHRIHLKGDTVLKLDIYKPCKYDSSKKNKTCPICHKKDKVIPIVYGLLISTKNKNPLKGNGKTFKAGGCNVTYCDPHWYCKRDKTDF